ncbi:hypothetical protein BDQ17DRAFT_1426349 [Cyathus striatus]|nr:hypothetical protein BDQ17DRAFT_1426349 [Cyathus striatus]
MALLPLPSFAHLRYLAIHNPLRAQPVLLNELLRVLGATEELRMLDLEARISIPLSPAPSLLPSSSPDLPSNDEHPALPHLTHLTLRANNLHEALDSMILPPYMRYP